MRVGDRRVPLDAVIITEELDRRPSRPPDYETECRSLASLMDVMASAVGAAGADHLLQELVETARTQCRAGSAGVSLLEQRRSGEFFRWRAAAGPWRDLVGGSVPRSESPSGVVLDQNSTLLMSYPERHFEFRGNRLPLAEVLLVPFHSEGRPVGTVWVIAHDDHHFDNEDRRVVKRLAQLAAAAYQLLEAHELRGQLADARLLQVTSAELVHQDDVSALYQRLLDTAIKIASSDCASIQRYDPGEGGGVLTLLAHRGFSPDAANFWAKVRTKHPHTPCGEALRSAQRVIVPDVEESEALAGSKDLLMFRQTEIRSCQSTPLVSRTGRLLGMMSTHWRLPHEASERDLLLLDLLARQAADVLEQKQASDAMRDADRRKDAFLATLAHELRNPLAPMSNATRILKLADSGSAEAEWARGVIERQVRQMVRLVDDLLDIGRIMRDSLELRREPVDVAVVLRAAIEASTPLIDERRHELVLVMPSNPVLIDGDAARLAQIFSNLLNNAAQYSDPGGRIILGAEREGSDVLVSVTDNGLGIPAARLPLIFEQFGQARVPQGSGGMGLGLALVKRLVEMHGGSVNASSAGISAGSTFTVRLPAVSL